MYGYFTLFGRLLLGGLFIGSAMGMVADPTGTQFFMTLYGMPFAGFFMWATVALLLTAASCLVLGLQIRWAALALALWLIPVTLIFHTNWSDPIQFHAFMENVGLMGALVFISGVGKSAYSMHIRSKAPAASRREIGVNLADA